MASAAVTADGSRAGTGRGLVLGISVIAGATFVVSASFNYMLTPMLGELNLDSADTNLALRVPSLAAMLVVFIAGRIGDRIGHRTVILAMAVPFVIGSIIVMLASGIVQVALGLLVEGVAASAIQIVAIGLLTARFVEVRARARAFASFGMASPVVYLVVPLLCGGLVAERSWRWIPGLWVVVGLVALATAWFTLPREGPAQRVGELWSSTFAGLFVVSVVQAISHSRYFGFTNPLTLAFAGFAVVSLVVVAVLLRRLHEPSLSLTPLKNGSTLILLVIVVLVPLLNTWLYLTLTYEYYYQLSVLQTAVILIPAQVAGIIGAKVIAGRLMHHLGVHRTGMVLLFGLAAAMALGFTVSATSSIAWITVYATAFGLMSTAVTVVIINAVMSTAPPEEAGNTSAFRGSAASIGAALGVVIMGWIVFGTAESVIQNELAANGMTPSQVRVTMQELGKAAESPHQAAAYTVPLPDGASFSDVEIDGLMAGLHANAGAGMVISLLAAGLFAAYPLASRRRTAVP